MSGKLENKVVNNEGDTFLHVAARSNDVDLAKRLITAGCDVNVKNKDGNPPLSLAVLEKHLKMVEVLLTAGASHVNDHFPRKEGPLHLASKEGFSEIVQLLLKFGADVNACEEVYQETPLHSVLKFQGFNADDVHEHYETVKSLIEAGANINAKGELDLTPWMLAMRYHYNQSFELMMSMETDILEEMTDDLTYVAVHFNNLLALKRYIELGCDANTIRVNGKTCLHKAARNARFEILEFLIQNGAAVNCVNNDGLDPLCHALQKWSVDYDINYDDMPDALRITNHDYDKMWEDYFPREYIDGMKCLNKLIEHGADVNHIIVRDQLTPLYLVLEDFRHHSDFLRILLKNGAKLDFAHPVVLEVFSNPEAYKFAYLLLKHVATFEAQNRSDGPKNFDMQKLDEKARKDYASCQDELELMKTTKFDDTNVSFFNILVDPNIGPYARNESIANAFEAMDIPKHFPIYSDLLVERFSEEVKFQKLVREATESLAYILNWDQNSMRIVLGKIISFFDKKDLTDLVSKKLF